MQKSCAGQDMFGVQLCAEAQVPDIASFRLQQIPVLSAFGQTDVRVSMEPSSDKPASIQLTSVVKNDEKGQRDVDFGYLLRVPDTDDVKQKNKNHETIPEHNTEQKKSSFVLRHLCPEHEVLTGFWVTNHLSQMYVLAVLHKILLLVFYSGI